MMLGCASLAWALRLVRFGLMRRDDGWRIVPLPFVCGDARQGRGALLQRRDLRGEDSTLSAEVGGRIAPRRADEDVRPLGEA
ncbi:MAG: hypothetical protein KGS47_07425 [Chloroflexi bacterium]|nr:hypothetical protein [Chloroflexota bacterium]